MARKLPEYNASSLADIAFMLLIFFLVTTTMDVDSGLERKLPQWVDPETLDENDAPPIKDRNIFEVRVDKTDRLMVEGELCRVEDLKEKTKEFLLNPADKTNLPEKRIENVPFFGDMELVAKSAVISLQNDIGTSYGRYIEVQNVLVASVNELRDEVSKRQFNKLYADLDDERQEAVRIVVPQKISEAEPKKVGGR